MTSALRFTASSVSDVGRVRKDNDDFGLVYLSPAQQLPARALLMVADTWTGSMTDHARNAGRLASEFVLTTILAQLHHLLDQPSPAPHSAPSLVNQLQAAITLANQELCRQAGRLGLIDGLACGLIQDDLAVIVNHASARVYLLRDMALRLITDHFPWGYLTADATHAYGALLGETTRVQPNYWQGPNKHDPEFGRRASSTAAVQLNVWAESLQAEDRLLVCTDGLWGLVHEETMASYLSDAASPRVAAQRLIEAANTQGGHDNVTVIVLDVIGG